LTFQRERGKKKSAILIDLLLLAAIPRKPNLKKLNKQACCSISLYTFDLQATVCQSRPHGICKTRNW